LAENQEIIFTTFAGFKVVLKHSVKRHWIDEPCKLMLALLRKPGHSFISWEL